MSQNTEQTAAQLIETVRGFAGRRVVVLGDLVADEFVYGDIARISREAPVLILEQRKTELVPGGGGNAVANLAALGACPLPVGVLGDDATGNRMLETFSNLGIDVSGIVVAGEYETPTKSRILAGGVHTRRQQIVRIDRGRSNSDLPSAISRQVADSLLRSLKDADGLLVADYGYGAATPDGVRGIASTLEQRKLPVVVDSRTRIKRYERATACTPNQEELERALELAPLQDEAAVEAAGSRLLQQTGNQAVLVTRGAQGMSLFVRDRQPLHVPAYGSDEVADVTGAGDTVIAAFTLARLAGAGFDDATRLANHAAGLVVMKAGTATVDPAELIAAILEDHQK